MQNSLKHRLVAICLPSSLQLPMVLPSLPLVQVGQDVGEEDVLLLLLHSTAAAMLSCPN